MRRILLVLMATIGIQPLFAEGHSASTVVGTSTVVRAAAAPVRDARCQWKCNMHRNAADPDNDRLWTYTWDYTSNGNSCAAQDCIANESDKRIDDRFVDLTSPCAGSVETEEGTTDSWDYTGREVRGLCRSGAGLGRRMKPEEPPSCQITFRPVVRMRGLIVSCHFYADINISLSHPRYLNSALLTGPMKDWPTDEEGEYIPDAAPFFATQFEDMTSGTNELIASEVDRRNGALASFSVRQTMGWSISGSHLDLLNELGQQNAVQFSVSDSVGGLNKVPFNQAGGDSKNGMCTSSISLSSINECRAYLGRPPLSTLPASQRTIKAK